MHVMHIQCSLLTDTPPPHTHTQVEDACATYYESASPIRRTGRNHYSQQTLVQMVPL